MIITPGDMVWLTGAATLVSVGQPVGPRGKQTIEVINGTFRFPLNTPIITVPERKLSYNFMAGEAAWILSGSNKVSDIVEYAPSIEQFSDNGTFFFGSYGPKIVDQISHVIQAIVTDAATRQAVINIWRENPRATKDVPCTINMQFLVRNDILHMIVNMRSSDLWLGLPYDSFNFSMVALAVRNMLALKYNLNFHMGLLLINCGSSHIYDKNLDAVCKILKSTAWSDSKEPIEAKPLYAIPKPLYNMHYEDLVSYLQSAAIKGSLLDDFSAKE